MYTICVVEDDAMLAEIYMTFLTSAGMTAHHAADGEVALQLIEKTSPDLVLLDLMIPQKSGDQVLREMRSTEWGKDTKVVMLTNISESEAPDDIRNYHIERYIVKANLISNTLPTICEEIILSS